MKRILWRRLDNSTMEYCTFQLRETTMISGQVIGDLSGTFGKVEYVVSCLSDGSTKSVSVHVNTLTKEVLLNFRRETSGLWLVNGQERPDLEECKDVDIGVTPATNTLPIRRFQLKVGESRELVAAWLRFPELHVAPMRQRYTRLGENTYLYESVMSGYKAELTVDGDSIVQTYAGEWIAMTSG